MTEVNGWVIAAIGVAMATQVGAMQSTTVPVESKQNILAKASTTDLEALINKWKAGGEDSFFAIAIGSAEGTRTNNGGKTSLYEGHTDPGNGVWNRGSFSYQFGNSENLSAEESSRRQLAKIIGHLQVSVLPKAKELGLQLTEWELMNAADLANQAPLCITESGGFVERLAQARAQQKQKNWTDYQVVLWARIESFWDPNAGKYDAAGLRAYDDMGKRMSIAKDQDRRMSQIRGAFLLKGMAVNGGETEKLVNYKPPTSSFNRWILTRGGGVDRQLPSRGDRVPTEATTEELESFLSTHSK